MKIKGDLRREELDIARRLDLITQSTDFNLPLDLLIAALVAGEDRRFYSHQGFDVAGMLSAAWGYLRTGKIRGASTIEMQLVRTLRGRYELTFARKISEIYLAHRIAKTHPKSAIARAYLIVAYFGWKANGIRQAATRLKLDLLSLDIGAASHIVALLKYPLPKEPTDVHQGKVIVRAQYIARQIK